MLARVGKSLILVTVILTIAVATMLAKMPALDQGGLFMEVFARDQGILASLFFLAFSLILAMLVAYFSERRRSARRGSGEADGGLGIPASGEEKQRLGDGQSISRPEAIHTLRTMPVNGVHPGRLGSLSKSPSLAGSTMRMYWALLSRRPNSVGLREVQRELGFSSPSSAIYQLEKLIKLGLVEKDPMGDYVVRKVIKVGILRDFFFICGHALPKNAVYGALTVLINAICFALLLNMRVEILVYFALLPGLFSSCVFWYEALKTHASRKSLAGIVS